MSKDEQGAWTRYSENKNKTTRRQGACGHDIDGTYKGRFDKESGRSKLRRSACCLPGDTRKVHPNSREPRKR